MADKLNRTKVCSKCGEEKPLKEFHRHQQGRLGVRGDCKICHNLQIRRRASSNREEIRERGRRYYASRRTMMLDRNRRYRAKNPEVVKAHSAVNTAIRDGHLDRQSCEVCGAKPADAHHDDYSKAFDIRWLCRSHHLDLHASSGTEAFSEEPQDIPLHFP